MINKLSEILEKKGSKYVENFLDNEVIITEKLDVFRITFEQNNGVLSFYNSDNKIIDKISRTLNDIWEPVILEIPTLINETKLPEGIRFGVAYTPVERPLRIPYTNLPRYILTDMTKRQNGKIIESYDYDEITEWAGILCMGRPPIIFKGKLTEEQQKILLSYDTKQYEGEFNNFSEMIESVLKNSYSKEKIIEGIVIKSQKNISQIISYEFELLDEAYKKINPSRDFYDIVLLSINEFMDSYNFPILESETSDELYIEIISDIFEKYCETEKISKGLEPSYLTSPQYGHIGNLNTQFIKNKNALQYIKSAPIYEALYRVFLSSFRKYKKPFGLLSESIVDKFNSYVGIILNKINEDNSIDYNNEPIYTALNEQMSDNIVVKKIKERQFTDIDNMRVISSVQRAFNPPSYNINQGKERVAIYLTTFDPFTSAQLVNVQQIHEKWNVPVLLAAVSGNRKQKGVNFHLSDNLVQSQMKSLSNFNKTIIPNFMLLDTWRLKEIFEFCRPDYEPLIIITDSGKKSELSLQLYFEEEMLGGKINVLPEFNIGEMENKEKLVAARAVQDGNGSSFIELTPKSIHNFYDNIINEYRIWEGSILPQFQPTIYNEVK